MRGTFLCVALTVAAAGLMAGSPDHARAASAAPPQAAHQTAAPAARTEHGEAQG